MIELLVDIIAKGIVVENKPVEKGVYYENKR